MKKETKLSKTCEKFIDAGTKALIIENDNKGEGKRPSSAKSFKTLNTDLEVKGRPCSPKIPKGFISAFGTLYLEKAIYDKRFELIEEIIEQCDSSCSKAVIDILKGECD